MIYLKGLKRMLILEPGNLTDLKAGECVFSPDKEVLIFYTPDLIKFQQKFMKIVDTDGNFDPEEFDKIHKESLKNPERYQRPYHEIYDPRKKGETK